MPCGCSVIYRLVLGGVVRCFLICPRGDMHDTNLFLRTGRRSRFSRLALFRDLRSNLGVCFSHPDGLLLNVIGICGENCWFGYMDVEGCRITKVRKARTAEFGHAKFDLELQTVFMHILFSPTTESHIHTLPSEIAPPEQYLQGIIILSVVMLSTS